MRVAIVGAGPGGYVAAIRAAQLGASVVVIERHEVGGTCLHWGCIPTKTLLASSELYTKLKDLEDFGLSCTGRISPDLPKIIARKDRVIASQVKGIRSLLRARGIELIEGRASFVSPSELSVTAGDGTDRRVRADAFIIATGSRPSPLPGLSFNGIDIITSTEALSPVLLPRRLLIIGAGAIGCEFAFLYSGLGSEVTLVELLDRALPTEDETISRLLARELKKRRIGLITGTRVERVERQADGIHAILITGSEVIADRVLVSIGRAFNADGLGLEKAGIATGPRGEITVNAFLQTSVPHIYAVGDVTGVMLLAHVASRQGMTAAEHIMGGRTPMEYSVVPAAIFTSPEIGSVGLREHQAREQGIHYRIGEFPMRALGRAHALGALTGLVKIIADADTNRILGAHIMGPNASDLVHEFAVAMQNRLTVRDIAATIHAHPTFSEALAEAAEDVHGTAIHLPPPER